MPRFGLPALVAALAAAPALAQPVTRADLKPGLAFTARDAGEKSRSVSRLEPGVALLLQPGESPHPQLAGGSDFAWRGYLNVLQPGKYKFAATLLGKLSVTVGGKPVLSGDVHDKARTVQGRDVELAAGYQPIEVDLARTGPAVQLELTWDGPGFRPEPIPYFFFGHLPKQRPASFAADAKLEHGRFLFEELSCVKCHQPGTDGAKTLVERTGPNLTDIGRRVYPGWLDAWLADPHKLRPNTTMPKLFADDARGRAERYAVVRYLASLGGPVPDERRVRRDEMGRSLGNGRRLYVTAGCAACHGEQLTRPPAKPKPKDDEDDKPALQPADSFYALGTSGPAGFYLLGAPGSKTQPDQLAKYLENPLAANPHGRMPNMALSRTEARDLARFLCRQTDDAINTDLPPEPKIEPTELVAAKEGKALAKLKPADQWKALGKRLLTTKGCANCHTIEPNGKKLPSLRPVGLAHDSASGCLAASPSAARVPVYALDAAQKAALAAFLRDGLTDPGTNAPAYQARRALRRFNCLNCHNRDGEGGFAPELADHMRLLEKAENADDVSPPRLTGVGHKVRTSWFKQVLTSAGRARPWMTLRMPQYGEPNVGFLADALPKLEGTTPDDTPGKVDLTAAQVEAGRTLAGKNGHGCISCHDISGVRGGGTRGPDLVRTRDRVRYDWYVRWMHQPQRLAPGTRMPQNFIDGKALLTSVYGGDGDKQIAALWAYLSLGPGLPLPAGMEPPKGLIVAVKDRPEVLRTFMPDGAGSKAIAVGFPGGVNAVFDAAQCRLSYAWSGNFLDASPVWNNRGGAPAKLLGPKFWTGPAGFPWAVTDSRTPPDFLKRADDPAYGHPLPEDRFYGGPHFVHFGGYALDKAGTPTFRYALTDDAGTQQLAVTETAAPLPVTVASGLKRTFAVKLPAGKTTWLFAGVAHKQPRVYRADGTPVAPEARAVEFEAPAPGSRVVLPEAGDHATVLDLSAAPAGSAWRCVPRPGGEWLVLLRLPEASAGGKATVAYSVWGLPRDDEALLKGLGAK
jgi:cbb3-type cytochrome oxidase cytochrome c subunit